MQKKLLSGICCVIMMCLSGPSLVQALPIEVYTDRTSWENSAPGTVVEESFDDAMLNTEITVVSDHGSVDTGGGRWWDRVSTSRNWTTTFNFSHNIFAFGGEWDLAGPGGPGQGLLITLPFSTAPTVLSVDRSNSGDFWGFVSDTGFNSVMIQGWTQSGWAETYEMDNLVYSAPTGSGNVVPEPQTILLLGSGLGGLFGWWIWKRRA